MSRPAKKIDVSRLSYPDPNLRPALIFASLGKPHCCSGNDARIYEKKRGDSETTGDVAGISASMQEGRTYAPERRSCLLMSPMCKQN